MIKKVGSGAFGEIYKGINLKTGEECAIKLEPAKTKYPQLYYEAKLYKIFDGAVGLPKLYYYSQEGDYNVMVIDLLGPSLEELFEYCRRKFTLKTVLMIAIQMLQRIEFVHQNGFLHRDIKPDNYLIGSGKNQHIIYIIDFGLAKRYKDPKTGRHISFKDNKSLTGTARYASLNTHLGIEQARRDDLEQIGIVLMYFLRGNLPWQGLPAKTKEEKYEQIKIKKAVTSIEDLTAGYPKEFQQYLNYSRKLKFEEKPDYQQVISMFRELFVREGFDFDFMYDWILKKQAMKQRLAASTRNTQRVEEEKKNTIDQANRANNTQQNQHRDLQNNSSLVQGLQTITGNFQYNNDYQPVQQQPIIQSKLRESASMIRNPNDIMMKYNSNGRQPSVENTNMLQSLTQGQSTSNQFYLQQNKMSNDQQMKNRQMRNEFKSSAQHILDGQAGAVPLPNIAKQNSNSNTRVNSQLNNKRLESNASQMLSQPFSMGLQSQNMMNSYYQNR
eukprot:403365855